MSDALFQEHVRGATPDVWHPSADGLRDKHPRAAKEAHTLLEINNHSLAPQRNKTVARDNNLEILRLCKKYEVPTILGSDAHISFQIADYERLYPLLAETEFPDELVMNYWPEKFFDYLGI